MRKKRKKKSLTGYTYSNWNQDFKRVELSRIKFPAWIYTNNQGMSGLTKVRVTIEEIP